MPLGETRGEKPSVSMVTVLLAGDTLPMLPCSVFTPKTMGPFSPGYVARAGVIEPIAMARVASTRPMHFSRRAGLRDDALDGVMTRELSVDMNAPQ
ncbi:hypothetical protein A8M77_34320 [Variovorax sp. JS1663]|nr:hypothetical protein A8M77_34320 [Variovorax sp. JS1663]